MLGGVGPIDEAADGGGMDQVAVVEVLEVESMPDMIELSEPQEHGHQERAIPWSNHQPSDWEGEPRYQELDHSLASGPHVLQCPGPSEVVLGLDEPDGRVGHAEPEAGGRVKDTHGAVVDSA